MKYFHSVVFLLVFLFAAPAEAKRIAAVFGVNYTNNQSGIDPLELCEKDARLMERTLKQHGNFDSAHVLLGEMVTADRVRSTIEQVKSEASPGDTVVFYFSGHGAMARDPRAPDGLRNQLVMFGRPHVSDQDLKNWMSGIRTTNVVWVFDACFSGGLAGDNRRGSGLVPVAEGSGGTVIQNSRDRFDWDDRVVVASSDASEVSIEIRGGIDHGLFTYHFARALNPANGDLNRDGTVTVLEAFEWSASRVSETARRHNIRQTPQVSGKASGIALAGRNLPSQPPADPPQIPDLPSPVITPPAPVLPGEPGPAEPEQNLRTGKIRLATTIFQMVQAGPPPNDPLLRLERNREDLREREVKVYISGQPVDANIRWLDRSQLKRATGEDVPLGSFSHQSRPYRNRVAYIEIDDVQPGVHSLMIEAEGYPVLEERIGVEEGGNHERFIVSSLADYGTIRGHVYYRSFDSPLSGHEVWLPTVTAVNQTHRMTTTSDGSFWFLNLPASPFYEIRASFREDLDLENQRFVITGGETITLDVVLTEK